ncbi:hypothetical protein [Allopusillimonas soli]|uniref:PIN domain-containing protein n=1 Tax=Allopusillimonas soli TaxID=659016 RepID=A0A853FDD1_9BURK|nr:hypothetical protein [Allopusillimonas soli]NYT38835.1 hypothetical protein [Allopusillimonas soli]
MSIDPSKFHSVNVTDTCSVWNILSSNRLRAATKEAHCYFCITSFVHYECMIKPRKSPTEADNELRRRLQTEQQRGSFPVHSCSIEDLQSVKLLESRRRLGMGEISSIAFAMKNRQAVLTDDQKARKLADEAGHNLVQTTPHLFSWLIFTRKLNDSDVQIVIDEHKALEGDLARHLEKGYEIALECQLNTRPINSDTPSDSSQPTQAPLESGG